MKRKIELSEDVVTLARRRIVNLFDNGLPVRMSISGGKDSIVLAHLTYQLIREGAIDPSRLTVDFIDEEAMHEEVIRITKDWRTRFLKVGAQFRWWCIETRHYNCLNSLEEDESFITWDRREKDRWVRDMPPFAIRSHPDLKPGKDSYQEFLSRISKHCIVYTGVRVAESVQRLGAFKEKPTEMKFQPIYDWTDPDVWLYIKEHKLDFPETYIHLYQTGSSRREMRLSQFFSVDTVKVLVKLAEHDPDLMERVTRREPNAYLASLYFDSEMFRRGSAEPTVSHHQKTRNAEAEARGEEPVLSTWKDTALTELAKPEFKHYRKGETATSKQKLARVLRNLIKRTGGVMSEAAWHDLYKILVSGDPKLRATRSLYNKAYEMQTKNDLERITA